MINTNSRIVIISGWNKEENQGQVNRRKIWTANLGMWQTSAIGNMSICYAHKATCEKVGTPSQLSACPCPPTCVRSYSPGMLITASACWWFTKATPPAGDLWEPWMVHFTGREQCETLLLSLVLNLTSEVQTAEGINCSSTWIVPGKNPLFFHLISSRTVWKCQNDTPQHRAFLKKTPC